MSAGVLVGVLMLLLIPAMVFGLWTAIALGGAGMVVLYLSRGSLGLSAITSVVWNNMNSFVLVAIPLFLMMGEMILRSGAGGKFYLSVSALMGKTRGPLLHANTLSCAIFSAVSGSSVATAATIGTLAIPEMLKQGYQPRIVFGSLAAGGTLGILIPPSLSMIMYGALVQESVTKLFIAGLLPGLLLAGIFLVYGIVRIHFNPRLVPATDVLKEPGQRLREAIHIFPMTGILVLVLGGIYSGIITPTESAALGCLCSFALAWGYGKLNWNVVIEALDSTVRTTCMISIIIVGALIMSTAMTYSGAAREVTGWIVNMGLSKWTFFAVLCILYIVLGTLVDGISMVYLTLPILYPSVVAMGFDPIWFGVVLTVLIEMGQIHPPVGLNLFTIHAIAKGHSFSDVVMGSAPYVGLIFLMLIILALWPGLATWLPKMM